MRAQDVPDEKRYSVFAITCRVRMVLNLLKVFREDRFDQSPFQWECSRDTAPPMMHRTEQDAAGRLRARRVFVQHAASTSGIE